VTALRKGPNGDFVYVVNEDRTVALRNVTRGEAGVDNVAITNGLELGEQVVTEGGDRLKDGARVQTSVERPAGAASGAASGGRGRRGGSGASGAGGAHGAGSDAAAAATPAGSGAGSGAASARGPGPAAPVATAPSTPATAAPIALPTAEQRQRLLDQAKDDPEQLERRKRFLEALDRGDAAALERWQQMAARRREGGGSGPAQ